MGLALTNPGIQYEDSQPQIDPNTGQPLPVVPNVKFFKNKAARNSQYLADTEAAVSNTPLTLTSDNSQGPVGAGPAPVLGTPNIPKPVQPSFSQLNTPNPETGQTPTPPAGSETKLGKLVSILGDAARGAAAGAGQPNFGAGFQAAQERPIQIASMRNALLQQQAQTALTKAQSAMVPTPYGPLPAALAKVMFPALINSGSRERVAQTAATSRENVADTAARSREAVAGVNKRFVPVQGVGLYDTQTKAMVPNTAQGITITPELAQKYQLPDEYVGKPLSLQNLASIQRSSVFENTPEMTAEGPIVINRRTSTATPVTGPGGQRYSPTVLAGPQQIADPNNPGQTTFVTKGKAIASGAAGPQSASVQVPKTAMKAEVPTKIGDQKVAFTTMIQHAELLREAAKALNNGDVQTLAGLKNAFKNEFGYAGPITANAIADAYKGEVSNVINKGHITDQGNEKIAHTLDPSKQNYATMDSVLGAYQSLAQSKMNMLNKQEQNAVNQSQPGKQGMVSQPGEPTATGPGGHKIAFRNGAWVDAQTGAPVK